MPGQRLEELLSEKRSELRDPAVVMAPERLGAARLTRYSFSRSVLRRAWNNGWTISADHVDLDADGQGEVAFRVEAEEHVFYFVALLVALDESEHTDRVIAERWEIGAALIEGELTDARREHLRSEVPKQERGRLGPEVLTLTRGNRSLRFFDYLVDELAAGRQPDPELVGDAGYIMRSTAFYANGKFGMRSFDGYTSEHPLAAPYRAQFLAAWCFRELSYLVVEEAARLRGGSSAVAFDGGWRTFFGLGNATGLGLVPYAFKHPRVINAWVAVRELALARVRALPRTDESVAKFRSWLVWAEAHYRSGTNEDAGPFLCPAELVPVVQSISMAFDDVADRSLPFDELMHWAADQPVETCELAVSLLIELDRHPDDEVDEILRVSEKAPLDLSTSVGEALDLLSDRFGWIDDFDFGDTAELRNWWVYSDNTEEPRRIDRETLMVRNHDMGIDIAHRMGALRTELEGWPPDATLAELAASKPEQVSAVERLFISDQPYGEPRDNACSSGYLPLQLQRFQLAQYGMDNFKPKSTDWLRVTLFQGAPRIADLGGPFPDDWVLPPMPNGAE